MSIKRLLTLTLLLSLLMLVLVALAACVMFGSVEHSLRYLSGQKVVLVGSKVSRPEATAGKKSAFTVTLLNISFDEVKVVGAVPSCKCSVVAGVPATLQPGGKVNISFNVSPPKSSAGKRYETSIAFYINQKHPPIVVVVAIERII